jgi:hypothetical protein
VAKITGIKVVEIEKVAVPEMDKAGAAYSVASLRGNPGFEYLLAKLRVQRALLRESLVKNKHKDIRDVEFLQSGANWLGWLEDQLNTAVGIVNAPKPRIARPFEQEAFEQLRQNVELVGVRDADNGFVETTPQG